MSLILPADVDTARGGIEQTLAEGNVQRQVPMEGRTLHVTGIAPTGFNTGDLLAIGVYVKDPSRIAQAFTVHELTDTAGVRERAAPIRRASERTPVRIHRRP
ncbi:hypothetical protein [Gemmatimonas aurantiaca]|uniref:hypothetical protein n=1 Tax=Gemmatimonas aurantiaca TaxID=173480 RepID=UPI00301C4A9B